MHARWPACALVLFIAVVVAGCTSSIPPSPQATTVPPGPAGPVGSSGMIVRVGSLNPGDPVPAIYTCAGASETPPVSWENIPPGTKGLVLILDDPDAPRGTFTHWILYNIPPAPGEFAAGQPDMKVLPDGAQQGVSSSGLRGYYPPCPSDGKQHRYIFHLYAADTDIAMPTADRASIDAALAGHTVAETDFVTTFKR